MTKDAPNYKDDIYNNCADSLKIMSDVTSGIKAMREGKYLIAFDGEDQEELSNRTKQAEYNNAVNETINTAVGKIHRKPLEFIDCDASIEEWAKDVTGRRTTLNEWAKRESRKAIRDGVVYCLIDFPRVEGIENMTKAQIDALNLQPKLSTVLYSDILNRVIGDNGELQQVTIREFITKQDGRFKQYKQEQYRVMYIEGDEVYQDIYIEEQGDFIALEEGVRITAGTNVSKLVKIPLVPFYTNEISPHQAKPPLLEQANLLINWFNVNSQYKRALITVGDPTLALRGRQPNEMGYFEPIKIGARSVIDYDSDTVPQYLELNGSSLPEFRENLASLQERLNEFNAKLLAKDSSVSTKQIERENSDSASLLTNFAWGEDDYLNGIKEFISVYLNVEDKGAIESNKEFDEYKVTDTMLDKLSSLEVKGQLTKQTLLELLKKGEILPDGFDIEEELGRLQEQSPLMA